MKKLLPFALALLIFSSCTKNDDDNTSKSLLLKRSIEKTLEDGTFTSDYEYSGNRITKITYTNELYYPDGTYEVFNYKNDRLTTTEFFIANIFTERKTFEYNDKGKIISIYTEGDDPELADRTIFSYNNDGTIKTEQYSISIEDEETLEELSSTSILTLSNGNIIKNEVIYTTGEKMTTTSSYDSFNSPLKSAFANDVLVLSTLEGGPNNIISQTISQDNEPNIITSFSIEYNSSGYPTSIIHPQLKGEYIYY